MSSMCSIRASKLLHTHAHTHTQTFILVVFVLFLFEKQNKTVYFPSNKIFTCVFNRMPLRIVVISRSCNSKAMTVYMYMM